MVQAVVGALVTPSSLQIMARSMTGRTVMRGRDLAGMRALAAFHVVGNRQPIAVVVGDPNANVGYLLMFADLSASERACVMQDVELLHEVMHG